MQTTISRTYGTDRLMNTNSLYRLLAYGLGTLLFCANLGLVIWVTG